MTSATTPKTIDLGGNCIQREAVAAAAITPGFLVALGSANTLGFVTEGQECAPAFAVEFDQTGRDIDDAYAIGDQVVYKVFAAGSRVYALIQDGETVLVNSALASEGNGKLKVAGNTDFVVGYAREATSPSGADGRCIVEIAPGRGIG